MRTFLIFFCSLLFLGGCHSYDPWHEEKLPNTNRKNDIAKLSYPAANHTHGIEIEFVRYGNKLRAYLNVHSYEIPCYENDTEKAEILFKTANTEEVFLVDRLKGGQRLKLTESALNSLINTLNDQEYLTITTGFYSQEFESKLFMDHYHSLMKKPKTLLLDKAISFGFD